MAHQHDSERELGHTRSATTPTLVVVLLTALVLQAVLSLLQKSAVADEPGYLLAGYHHLQTGRFDVNLTNPPLLKMLVAAPLLPLDLSLPGASAEFEFGPEAQQFVYANRADPDTILLLARLPVVGIAVVLGFYVFLWSSRLNGERAGLLALFLFAFSPNILAHARLATLDLGLAAFSFMAAYYLWRYTQEPSWRRLGATSLSFAAAVLTKTTALFLAPVALAWCALLAWSGRGPGVWPARAPLLRPERVRMRQATFLLASGIGVAIVVVAAVNTAYLFQGSFRSLSAHVSPERVHAKLGTDSRLTRAVVDGLLAIPLLIPRPLEKTARFQARRVSAGNRVYLAGEISREGWWYHMLFAFLVKTPLPMLVLLSLALCDLVLRRDARPAEWLCLLTCVWVFGLFAYFKSVSIGLRYVLLVYPFLFLLVSRLGRDSAAFRGWRGGVVGVMLCWYLVGTLRIYPHYLAHFNELVGGPRQGYKYLADSNLDWGQDLKGLRPWMEKHRIDRIRLAYFGVGDAEYYGVDYEYLPSVGLRPPPGTPPWPEQRIEDLPPLDLSRGPIAVSATLLSGVFLGDYYADLRGREPVDSVGHSILIFDAAQVSERGAPDDPEDVRP